MGHSFINKTKGNESGLVSIIVVTIVIIILSLMTIGFAKIMDRELRQSLDRELATQANYAAESGMNDARNYVLDRIKNNQIADIGPDCLNTDALSAPQQQYFVDSGSISAGSASTVKYTCVTVDTHPKELLFDKIPAGHSKIFRVVTSDVLDRLYFSWNNSGATSSTGATALSALGTFPAESYWSGAGHDKATGVLRATVYPVSGAGVGALGDQNANLENLARTYFMYPNGAGPGIVGFEGFGANNGTVVAGNCNQNNFTTSPLPYKQSKHFCNSGLTGMSASPPFFYYVRITAIYRDLTVSVQGTNASGNPLKFDKAQGVIDVTAKGNDVLKRLQGRVSLDSDYDYPEYTIQSMDTLCKRLRLPKTGPSSYDQARIDDPDLGDAGVAASCEPT